ncbi:hypothetical protein HAX54_014662 [Datura stramonium]|uniref:Uncharacterized protein n=1 Tax=Datura stramonium TaxID=4076 RepID=A0ABS8TQC4_DATST|nr:hypothetical protein [Datura stramonium]
MEESTVVAFDQEARRWQQLCGWMTDCRLLKALDLQLEVHAFIQIAGFQLDSRSQETTQRLFNDKTHTQEALVK